MKQRDSKGLGVKMSSNIITLANEDKMFNTGVLGEDSPNQLIRTIIYMVGLHCCGSEHLNLRRPGCKSQFSLEHDQLIYHEDPLTKTSQGGLLSKGISKIVYVYPFENQRHCSVYLFKKYVHLMPNSKSCKKFYLHVKRNATPCMWYCDPPYGLNKLKSAVKEITKEAGIEGKFTNHSLRATCASRMKKINFCTLS